MGKIVSEVNWRMQRKLNTSLKKPINGGMLALITSVSMKVKTKVGWE